MDRNVPVPPRPDLPFPGPSMAGKPPRRRARWIAALAALLALTISAVAIGWSSDHVQGEFRFLGTLPGGVPFRWNPCQPIHYQVNLAHAPSSALADVREAVGRASDATGIAFVYDGETVRTPDQQIGSAFQSTVPGQARWLPLLFAWVPHQHFDFIVDTDRAAAFGLPDRGDGNLSNTYVSGVIAVDAGGHLPPGFAGRYSLGPVLMHELGHIMGLAHVGSAQELMWSPDVAHGAEVPDLHQSDYGPGDLEGLAKLGRSAGCLPARDPPV